MLRLTYALLLFALVLVAGTGCAAVKPWDRGRLAKSKMQLDPSPEATLLEQHVFEYREGSSGGFGTVGGGCGCN
jgi:hypothetical protein